MRGGGIFFQNATALLFFIYFMGILSLSESLYSCLSSSSLITDIVSDRIYPVVAERGSKLPLLAYRQTGRVERRTKDGRSSGTAGVSVCCFGNSYDIVARLGDGVISALAENGSYECLGIVESFNDELEYYCLELSFEYLQD